MGTDGARRLTVYGRAQCPLCEEMTAGLRRLQAFHDFDFAVVDIDRDEGLVQRYGDKVPVLAYGSRELCRYRLDTVAVTAFLNEFR